MFWKIIGAAVSAGATTTGGLVETYANFRNAAQQIALTQQQAGIAYMNGVIQSDLEKQNAKNVQAAADTAEYNARKEQSEHRAQMEVAIASNGVEMSGTALEMMAEQARADGTNNEYMLQEYRAAQAQHIMNADQALEAGRQENYYLNQNAKLMKSNAKFQALVGVFNAFNEGAKQFGQSMASM